MLSRKMLFVFLLFLAIIGFVIVCGQSKSSEASPVKPSYDIWELPALHEGDLIFRKGRSLVSRVVLMNDRASPYSHVGIVAFKNGEPFVVHAVPGEPDVNGEEKVKCDTPADFLDNEKADLFAVFRMTDDEKHQAKMAAQKAMDYFEMGLPFDKTLDFRSNDKLYCTELVWKAYLAADINLTGNEFYVLTMSLFADSIILPGQLIESKWLTQIYP